MNWKNRINAIMTDSNGFNTINSGDNNEINEFYISNLMVKVIEKTDNEIQNFKVIRNIIDEQYIYTKKFFYVLNIIKKRLTLKG